MIISCEQFTLVLIEVFPTFIFHLSSSEGFYSNKFLLQFLMKKVFSFIFCDKMKVSEESRRASPISSNKCREVNPMILDNVDSMLRPNLSEMGKRNLNYRLNADVLDNSATKVIFIWQLEKKDLRYDLQE